LAKITDYVALGQSIWLDYLRRAIITSGELQQYIAQGLGGLTSNPSIFEKAIDGSTDYDEELKNLVKDGKSPQQILEVLMIEDVGRSADLFRPLYSSSGGADGFVSIEVNPKISDNTEAMIAEAKRFHSELHRPNVMIKIPATPSGFPAIERLTSQGVNVNVTLIFSIDQYKAAAEAYLSGLEKFAASGGNLRQVTSVASFFVSRVDTIVDDILKKKGNTMLEGKTGIANAKLAYQEFRRIFKGSRWDKLAKQGAHIQRVLWGSTSVKDPAYPDTLYCDSLIGPDTVDTVPPATLRAMLDHGNPSRTIDSKLGEAQEQLKQLSQLGIDLERVTEDLEQDGVEKFTKSLDTVIATITEKHDQLVEQWRHESAKLGYYEEAVSASLTKMAEEKVVQRIWSHDYTVWEPSPQEISNRLGWLHTVETMQEMLPRITDFVEATRQAGFTEVLLLGMGGSSLAPKVFAKSFEPRKGYLKLSVLDTIDPDSVAAQTKPLDPNEVIYAVATKSGSTAETISLMKYFYGKAVFDLGEDEAKKHFIAITDPGSPLAETAERFQFRAQFLNDPNIGGRYSALSYYGLVPAALLGVDVARLLEESSSAVHACESTVSCKENPGAWLGTVLGELAKAGRDKITIICSQKLSSFGDWVEQLIAESTGKEGKGLLPVVGEPVGPPEVYGNDRLFIYVRLDGDTAQDEAVAKLVAAGQPMMRLQLHSPYELGRQFFVWEMAVAIAGHIIGINPFDQPNVESAKALARKNLELSKTKAITNPTPDLFGGDLLLYGKVQGNSVKDALENFFKQINPGGYVAILAYLTETPETEEALTAVRTRIRNRYKVATTVGNGPRYLHSIGQLYKGDAGRGIFLQITADDAEDLDIPDELDSPASATSFSMLKQAEAMGDQQALESAGRRIIRIHLAEVSRGLTKLNEALA